MSAEDTLTTLEATKTEPPHTFGPTQNMRTLCTYNSHHHRRRHLSILPCVQNKGSNQWQGPDRATPKTNDKLAVGDRDAGQLPNRPSTV